MIEQIAPNMIILSVVLLRYIIKAMVLYSLIIATQKI